VLRWLPDDPQAGFWTILELSQILRFVSEAGGEEQTVHNAWRERPTELTSSAGHLVVPQPGRVMSLAGSPGWRQDRPCERLGRLYGEQRARLQHLIEGADGLRSLLSNVLQA
jgi:hypothetical protein